MHTYIIIHILIHTFVSTSTYIYIFVYILHMYIYINDLDYPNFYLICQALYSMVYCGLLLWLYSVRFVDTTDTLDTVDLFDLFLTSVEEETESHSSSIAHSHSISLWESYTRYSAVYGGISIGSNTPMNESLIRATTHLLNFSMPSSTSSLSRYLSTIGQHSVLSRMASVLVWGGEFIGTECLYIYIYLNVFRYVYTYIYIFIYT